MTDKLLFTDSEWSFDKIEKTWAVIDEIGSKQLGFDYYPAQIEIISSEQMIDNYSTHAMPQMYNHWSFGKTFIQNQNSYKSGQSGLAYEVVINTNPSIAYLMETNCVDSETEYLTKSGWKKITEYSGEDILGYNSDGTAEFVTPNEYVISKVNEPMVKIKAKGVDQLVTQNHRVIYQKRNGEIGEILAKDALKKHEELKQGWDGKIITAYNFKSTGKLDLSDDQIRLMCAVHADGCFPTEGTYCRFGFKKRYKAERLISILERCNLEYKISTRSARGYIHISCRPPMKSKKFTSEWYKASTSQLAIISEEVFYWDADLKTNKSYYSKHKSDVDFVQFACNSVGLSATIRSNPTCYSLIKSQCATRQLGNITEEGGTTESYCFKMPSTMWVARRNDKVFVTGNTMTMQALVLAHASVGHSSFFKTNYLFREWSDADSILDYLKFAKSYIDKCEKQYGEGEVEALLDACHSLQLHGVDKYKKPDFRNELAKQQARESHAEATYSDLWRVTSNIEHLAPRSTEGFQPEENILYFIEKNSPILKPWQREIVRIVRKIAQYFYPQRQTGLLNEAFACLNHHVIMNMMYDQGYITAGSVIEFLKSHAGVVAQPDWDSRYFSGINVYALGYAMMADLKRMCEAPDAEDKRLFPKICNTDWRETIKHVVANYRDESFISQFLSPKVCRQLQLFTIDMDEEHSYHRVSSVCPDESLHNIRSALSAQYDLSKRVPHIEIVNVDWEGDRSLTLHHFSSNGVMLGHEDLKKTAGYLHELWGHTVKMEYKTYDGEDI